MNKTLLLLLAALILATTPSAQAVSGAAMIFNVTVDTRSAVATLAGLAPSSGTLSPTFAAATTSYTASVPNATTSITVTPTVTDATATIKVNGTTVASGAASGAIALAVGTNAITAVVTAQDGTTTSTYTVTVTRPPSAIASLSALALSAGTLSPVFGTETLAYTASVPNSTISITVTPTVTDATATIKVNGTTVVSGTASASIPLVVGTNLITVLVTAQDGIATSTYTITVTRSATVSTLSALALSAGTLSPIFGTGTLAYTASVPNAASSITMIPTVTDATATVKVNGVSVTSGTASAAIPLAVGANTITVLVTAQDVSFTTTYTVTVTRPVLNATFASATTIPCSMANFTTPANAVNLSLGYAPSAGTNLMVVRNPGLDFISGRFSNLAQGQLVTLPYNNDTYRFVVNYYGGSGNDLVLQWADNKAYSWGSNSLGQLGDNDGANSSLPVAVSGSGVLANKTLVAVAVGSSHSLALCSDGTLAAWGNDIYGQLGDGTNNNSNVPVAVVTSGALSGKTVVAIAAGFNHSLALCSDGTVAAWGFNSAGQLGNGTTTSSNVPVAVTKTGALLNKTVVAVAAGYNHSLARCADGSVVTWGNNAYGQLGNNTTTNSNVPVDITASGELYGRTILFLVAGSDHSIGLCSDGSLVAWGRNNYGQLGNGSLVNSSIPVVVDASDVLSGKVITAIATGGWHTLALCSDGTLAAFGRGNNGQLGYGGTTDSNVPITVTTGSGALMGKAITTIAASNAHSLALCADGSLAAWGANNNGQLGNNTTTGSNVPTAVIRTTLGSGEKFTDLASGSSASHVLALAAFHLSSNSTLSGLALSVGTLNLGFASGTKDYTASVPNATALITITPTVTDATATLKVNGTTVVSGAASGSIPLSVGNNPIAVVVTAQDGTTTSTYTVTVNRISNVSTLSGLVLSSGTLSPVFAAGTLIYTASVPNATSSMMVTPTVTDATATIKVNGTTVVSGAASGSISLAVGSNTITTVVTAQDRITSKTYQVTVTRAGSYDAWKAAAFTNQTDLANPAVSGELATPANDGVTNLMKYAMALSPTASATGNLPTTASQAGYLTLTYRQNKTASDVTYTVQAADALTSNAWAPATTVLSQTDPTPGGGSYWLVTVRDNVPYATHPQRFMRLQVVK